MPGITNGLTVPMLIPQLRQRRGRAVMSRVRLDDHPIQHGLSRLPAPQLPSANQALLHLALQLPSGYQAAPALRLPFIDPVLQYVDEPLPALQLQFVLLQALQLPSGYQAPPALHILPFVRQALVLQALVNQALQLPSGYQAPPALRLLSVDPALQSVDEALPALQLPFVLQALQLPSGYQVPLALHLQFVIQALVHQALLLPSGYQAPPALRLLSVDPALQSVDEAPLALRLPSDDPAFQSVDEAPPALQLPLPDPALQPVDQAPALQLPSVISGIAADTLFQTLIGAGFSAAVALMLYHLQEQGNSAPAVSSPSPWPSSSIALTIVSVSFLLSFAFIATWVCLLNRFPVAAYISGRFGILCFLLSFYSMMHVCFPEHLVWLVWIVGGITLLMFACFSVIDLRGQRRTVAPDDELAEITVEQ